VAAPHQLMRDSELCRGVAAEREKCLEDAHCILILCLIR
jgi:hypothetical protein